MIFKSFISISVLKNSLFRADCIQDLTPKTAIFSCYQNISTLPNRIDFY